MCNFFIYNLPILNIGSAHDFFLVVNELFSNIILTKFIASSTVIIEIPKIV